MFSSFTFPPPVCLPPRGVKSQEWIPLPPLQERRESRPTDRRRGLPPFLFLSSPSSSFALLRAIGGKTQRGRKEGRPLTSRQSGTAAEEEEREEEGTGEPFSLNMAYEPSRTACLFFLLLLHHILLFQPPSSMCFACFLSPATPPGNVSIPLRIEGAKNRHM